MDALALGAEEGRGKRRYASGSCKQVLIRGFPNGGTTTRNGVVPPPEYIGWREAYQGTETSKYPEEKKTKVIP